MHAPARTFLSVFALAAAAALPPALAADGPLRWESTEATIDAPPLAETVQATFTFTNAADRAVTISEVHSSCGCTVPQLDKKLYAPGESGKIHAVFTIGERVGLQEKVITVTTAQPDFATTALTLRVQLPTLYEVKPYFVIWNRGEAPATKSIRVALLRPDVLAFDAVTSRHTNFTATAEPTDGDPQTLAVDITPQSTGVATNGSIELTFKTRDGRTRMVALYALIRDSRPPAPPSSGAPAPRPAAP